MEDILVTVELISNFYASLPCRFHTDVKLFFRYWINYRLQVRHQGLQLIQMDEELLLCGHNVQLLSETFLIVLHIHAQASLLQEGHSVL